MQAASGGGHNDLRSNSINASGQGAGQSQGDIGGLSGAYIHQSKNKAPGLSLQQQNAQGSMNGMRLRNLKGVHGNDK